MVCFHLQTFHYNCSFTQITHNFHNGYKKPTQNLAEENTRLFLQAMPLSNRVKHKHNIFIQIANFKYNTKQHHTP